MLDIDYTKDFDAFRTNKSLYNAMYFNKRIFPRTAKEEVIYKPRSKQVVPLYDFKSKDKVVIGIQNDQKFMNIIINSRRQKSLLAYIFIEQEYQYVTCIIKNPDGFPIILTRMPINGKNIYAKNVNACYEFPISDITSKDMKYNKSFSYVMLFKRDDQHIRFKFKMYNNSSEPDVVTNNDIDAKDLSVIDDLLNIYDVNIAMPLFTHEELGNEKRSNYSMFNNMTIKILAEANPSNLITFSGKSNPKTKNYFIIKNDKLLYVTETSKKGNDKYICSKDSPNTLYWDDINLENLKFEMHSFESLFKINYNKSILSNDRVYYLLTLFMDNYMFMKLITPIEITSETQIETFINTFSKDYQIAECYICHTVE